MGDEFLTIVQAAQLLKVNEHTLYRLCRGTAGPPVVRIGKAIRFSRAALEDWARGGGSSRAAS
jgi:excisionase family DNA binding protein